MNRNTQTFPERYLRYLDRSGTPRWGELEHGDLPDAQVHELATSPLHARTRTGRRVPFAGLRLLAPVDQPSKIICFGKNYAAHATEMGWAVPSEPVMFLKPPSAIVGPGAAIVLPATSRQVEPEAELAIVIGTAGKDIAPSDALSHVFGCTIANDVSARDLMVADGQWSRAKGFDTFLPLGPVLTRGVPAGDLGISTLLDGIESQSGRTSQMLWKLPELIALCSQAFSLAPGDLILTGSPAGRTPLSGGQVVSISIEGLGTLTNPVLDAPVLVATP